MKIQKNIVSFYLFIYSYINQIYKVIWDVIFRNVVKCKKFSEIFFTDMKILKFGKVMEKSEKDFTTFHFVKETFSKKNFRN